MKSLPTLLPWVRSHAFMLATLVSAAAVAYGWSTSEFNDYWWQYVGLGIVGLVTFGTMSIATERKSKLNLAVGIAGIAAGSLVMLVLALFFVLLLVVLFSLAGSH